MTASATATTEPGSGSSVTVTSSVAASSDDARTRDDQIFTSAETYTLVGAGNGVNPNIAGFRFTNLEKVLYPEEGITKGQVIAYYAGGGDVHLRGGTCVGVRAFLAGRHSEITAAAFSVLLHESLHRQGMRDERLANCFANEAVRWGAEWLGFGEERALAARDLAFAFTRRFAPPAYHIGMPDCLALTRRGDWLDHT